MDGIVGHERECHDEEYEEFIAPHQVLFIEGLGDALGLNDREAAIFWFNFADTLEGDERREWLKYNEQGAWEADEYEGGLEFGKLILQERGEDETKLCD